jgi:hypothetical protein
LYIELPLVFKWLKPGPYYPLGTVGTVPRAYDIFRAYEEIEGKNKNKEMKNMKI